MRSASRIAARTSFGGDASRVASPAAVAASAFAGGTGGACRIGVDISIGGSGGLRNSQSENANAATATPARKYTTFDFIAASAPSGCGNVANATRRRRCGAGLGDDELLVR